MAHRANVIQVGGSFESKDFPETVVDPVCEMELKRKDSKHLLVRDDQTLYFCSKECQGAFISKIHSIKSITRS